jgi:hypothetical protein
LQTETLKLLQSFLSATIPRLDRFLYPDELAWRRCANAVAEYS